MESIREYFTLNKKPQLTVAVSHSISNLQKATKQIVSEFQVPSFSLNKELSQLLIGKPKADYSRKIFDWISSITREIEKEPLLLTDIDILFEPSFELDPLAIFRQTSKNKKLLVIWLGNFSKNNLSYASPDHAHYRNWVNPGVEIIKV